MYVYTYKQVECVRVLGAARICVPVCVSVFVCTTSLKMRPPKTKA